MLRKQLGANHVETRVFDPVAAALKTGGCTYETFGCRENGFVGWWTFTPDSALASEIGQVFDGGSFP